MNKNNGFYLCDLCAFAREQKHIAWMECSGLFDRIEFEQPSKFTWGKFERPKVGLQGELQDVIRNAGPKGRILGCILKSGLRATDLKVLPYSPLFE